MRIDVGCMYFLCNSIRSMYFRCWIACVCSEMRVSFEERAAVIEGLVWSAALHHYRSVGV